MIGNILSEIDNSWMVEANHTPTSCICQNSLLMKIKSLVESLICDYPNFIIKIQTGH